MSFVVSQVQISVSEAEKVRLDHAEDQRESESETLGPISSQLHLKQSPRALDKQAVLRRIRHHKSLNKLRGAFKLWLPAQDRPTNPQFWTTTGSTQMTLSPPHNSQLPAC